MKKWVEFNVNQISYLKEQYEEAQKLTKEFLPPINWDSTKSVKSFFKNNLGIELKNVKIAHVLEFIDKFDHDSEEFDIINGYVLYLKYKYTLKNYINCILRHHENGRVYLRHESGTWMMPNKQPLSLNPEITGCITAKGEEE